MLSESDDSEVDSEEEDDTVRFSEDDYSMGGSDE